MAAAVTAGGALSANVARDPEPLPEDLPADEAMQALGDRVDEALAALPAALRAVLVLRYLERRGQAEIAEALGIDQSTVSRRIEQSLERLRERLRGRGGVPAVSLPDLLARLDSGHAPAVITQAIAKVALAGAPAASTSTVMIVAWILTGVVSATLAIGILIGRAASPHTEPPSLAVAPAGVTAPPTDPAPAVVPDLLALSIDLELDEEPPERVSEALQNAVWANGRWLAIAIPVAERRKLAPLSLSGKGLTLGTVVDVVVKLWGASVLSEKFAAYGAGPVGWLQGASDAAIAALSQGGCNAADGWRGQARCCEFLGQDTSWYRSGDSIVIGDRVDAEWRAARIADLDDPDAGGGSMPSTRWRPPLKRNR